MKNTKTHLWVGNILSHLHNYLRLHCSLVFSTALLIDCTLSINLLCLLLIFSNSSILYLISYTCFLNPYTCLSFYFSFSFYLDLPFSFSFSFSLFWSSFLFHYLLSNVDVYLYYIYLGLSLDISYLLTLELWCKY